MQTDKTIKDNDKDDDNKLMDEWEKYMKDFVPEDINTIVLSPKQEMVNSHVLMLNTRHSTKMLEKSQSMWEEHTSLGKEWKTSP